MCHHPLLQIASGLFRELSHFGESSLRVLDEYQRQRKHRLFLSSCLEDIMYLPTDLMGTNILLLNRKANGIDYFLLVSKERFKLEFLLILSINFLHADNCFNTSSDFET